MKLTRTGIDRFFKEYFAEKRGKRVSPRSVKNYRSTVYKFFSMYDRLEDDTINEFLASYDNPSSANVMLVRLNSLAEYLGVTIKVPRAIEPVKQPDALTSREVDRLVYECSLIHPTLGHAVRFLSNTGLRIHELYTLRETTLQHRDDVPHLRVLGKGQKYRDVPLSTDSVRSLQALTLPLDENFSEKRMRQGLTKAGKRAKLTLHAHPHLLRASCASIMLNERGEDSLKVAAILGWAKTDTLLKHYYKPSLTSLAKSVL